MGEPTYLVAYIWLKVSSSITYWLFFPNIETKDLQGRDEAVSTHHKTAARFKIGKWF
jgi:hypothetical protein